MAVTVSILLRAEEGTPPEAAKEAVEYLLARARRMPPDRRLDWATAQVVVEEAPRGV